MKFKHFTMEELNKMTQDQQRGYVIAELIYGLGCALTRGMKAIAVAETTDDQMELVAYMEKSFKRSMVLFNKAMTVDTEKFEQMLEKAVGAPKALGYE